ncbi:MAG: 2-C-methyl-D-erythritol 4-phosphate cytidylyltransferase [Desulfobacteraceae bacterium]|nr:2-C-methyl-D-erythritol 4-phosphate cytidylyltransferase [Desulfobacteraceae bacterium]MCB9495153.1 2-C-methyl-D-erythritol 4-phosphate cytidylyltransferase [Desulfobacteraceae bacterium]
MCFTSAVIVGGGKGLRMGSDIPKQFLSIDGLPILFHTALVFDSVEEIDEVLIVVPENLIEFCCDQIKVLNLKKSFKLVSGGKQRQDSVRNGLDQVDSKSSKVLIHDGVRPFVKKDEIISVINGLDLYDGVILGIPVVETIKKTDPGKIVNKTISRENLYLAQTPQGFKTSILKKVHEWALEDGLDVTDDSALMENFGFQVKMVEGSRENIKITTPSDLEFAKKLF